MTMPNPCCPLLSHFEYMSSCVAYTAYISDYAPMFCACTCRVLLHVFLFFWTFLVSICVLFFVWAASYDELMPPLAACHRNS